MCCWVLAQSDLSIGKMSYVCSGANLFIFSFVNLYSSVMGKCFWMCNEFSFMWQIHVKTDFFKGTSVFSSHRLKITWETVLHIWYLLVLPLRTLVCNSFERFGVRRCYVINDWVCCLFVCLFNDVLIVNFRSLYLNKYSYTWDGELKHLLKHEQ